MLNFYFQDGNEHRRNPRILPRKPAVTEGFPFNDTALVFKVAGKMFALLDLSEDERGISLKCDPELAIELREQHPEVTPAWHFNKIIMELFYTVGHFLSDA